LNNFISYHTLVSLKAQCHLLAIWFSRRQTLKSSWTTFSSFSHLCKRSGDIVWHIMVIISRPNLHRIFNSNNFITVVPIEVFLKYWFNTLPQADQFISSSSSRYSYTSCERANSKYLIISGHFLSIYDWLVAQTTKVIGAFKLFNRKFTIILGSMRNLMKLIGQPEVMYWINIWATLQLERQ
jgi:hypothetical protein